MVDYMIAVSVDCDIFLTEIENKYNVECSLFIMFILYQYIIDMRVTATTKGDEKVLENLHKDLNIAKEGKSLAEYVTDMKLLIDTNCSLALN